LLHHLKSTLQCRGFDVAWQSTPAGVVKVPSTMHHDLTIKRARRLPLCTRNDQVVRRARLLFHKRLDT
jgi:hypothetical protein